jgi:ectoine hydroxylase-related dioxygenase (phytanoyl-CoA dioxygenase family)
MVQRRVSQSEIADFRARGHVQLRGMFDVQRIQRLANAAIVTAESYLPSRDTARDLWKRSPDIEHLIFSERIGEIAADLLGVNGIRLIHDALFQKEGHQKATPWHRDSDFWAFEGVGAVTMWIPLQETPPDLALGYVSQSHIDGSKRLLRRFEKASLPWRHAVARGPMSLGDIAVHHCHTLHASSNYRGTRTRRALAVHVIDANARFAAPQTRYHESHNVLSGWGTLQPGDPFPDHIAPLLFERDATAELRYQILRSDESKQRPAVLGR